MTTDGAAAPSRRDGLPNPQRRRAAGLRRQKPRTGTLMSGTLAFGNVLCPRRHRRVPVGERPLLPGEERLVRELLEGAEG